MSARSALASSPLITYRVPSDRDDLLDPAKTQEDLIAMLSIIISQGIPFEVTSVRTDHGDDSELGPHGHARGFAIDVWPADSNAFATFLQNAATHNHLVTKIGLGGAAQHFFNAFAHGDTIVFTDNDQDHVHLQTA